MGQTKINLADKFSLFNEHWTPKIIGEMNGQYVKVGKGQGELIWHTHEDEDEFFLVLHGTLSIHIGDDIIHLSPGECFIVPRGVPHKTSAQSETHFLLVEPKTTQHTGQIQSDQTVDVENQVWI